MRDFMEKKNFDELSKYLNSTRYAFVTPSVLLQNLIQIVKLLEILIKKKFSHVCCHATFKPIP